MRINPELVIEHLQKQGAESEVVKFALDAAIRQAIIQDQQETIVKLEQALEAKDGEVAMNGGSKADKAIKSVPAPASS